ncbi:MAG TPA: hypothetical protein VF517_00395 [Thermoleophilaceae bacterium]
MKTLRLTPLAVIAALALAAPAQADTPADGHTTGAGTVTDLGNPFAPVRINVNASSVDGVAQGRVSVRNGEFRFVGDVQCYVQVGNTVEIAGQVVKSKTLDGGYYALSIQDNGETGDLVSLNASADIPLLCGQAGMPVFALEDGNLTVHAGLE